MSQSQPAKNDTFARFSSSAVAAAIAETFTLPTDVAKTRLQIQNNSSGLLKYNGFIHCITTTQKEEGTHALWKGLTPALIRQVSYTSLSLVLYEPVRDFFTGSSNAKPNFFQRLMAGGTAGAIAITVFNPTEVIKTQMMSSNTGPPKTMTAVIKHVFSNGGILGFWAGLQPNIIRTFLVNAAELGTYDQAKSVIIPYTGDNFGAHLGASTIAGITSACVSTPADVVKTRLMNQAGSVQQYKGVVDAGLQTLRKEGVLALYKGFTPIVIRKVLWCCAFFASYEQIRKAMNERK